MTRRTHLQIEALEDRCLLSFTPLASYDAGASALIAADFNNDDVADLALDSGEVLLGHGDGTFDSPTYSGGAGSIAVGDLDGDGNLDLVLPGWHDVSVRLGNGDGTFADASVVNVIDPAGGDSLSSVAVGDFDGDGLLDLGVVSITSVFGGYDSYGYPIFYNASSLHVLVGHGDGTFSGPSTTSLGGGYHTAAAAADFSGDGIDDLATADSDNGGISVVLGDSSGVLQGPTRYSTGASPRAVAVADVDGDLDTDLVVAGHYGVAVLLGDGAGGFADAQYYTASPWPLTVAVADFNGDGALDIATTSEFATASDTYSSIDVLLGYGDGTFAYPISQSLGVGTYADALAADDFDGDGLPDVVATTAESRTSVLTNAGGWVFPATLVIGDVTVTEGDGGTREAVFTVTRRENLDTTVTVSYFTADWNAAAGSDYQAASGTLTFAPGETSKTINVVVYGDAMVEPNEKFEVYLHNPVGTSVSDRTGVGTIVNDDTYVTPGISIGDATVTEGNAGTAYATLTVTLTSAAAMDVTVQYVTADGSAAAGSDYVAASGTLTFAAGETSRTVTVLVYGDRLGEPNETFFVNLSSPTNATIGDGQALGIIVDDEPRISISDVTKSEGKKGKTTLFTFTVTLSAAYDQAVTMSFATVNGTATTGDSDYIAKTGTLTFAPGETTKTITIEVKGDSKKEANETFYLDLFGNSSNSLFTKNRGIGMILNDD